MAFPPQARGRRVKLATAARLHGRGGRQQIAPLPQHRAAALRPLRQHTERKILTGNVDVSRVKSLARVFLAALTVAACIRLVPVVRAHGYSEQRQRAEGQQQPARRQHPHGRHVSGEMRGARLISTEHHLQQRAHDHVQRRPYHLKLAIAEGSQACVHTVPAGLDRHVVFPPQRCCSMFGSQDWRESQCGEWRLLMKALAIRPSIKTFSAHTNTMVPSVSIHHHLSKLQFAIEMT